MKKFKRLLIALSLVMCIGLAFAGCDAQKDKNIASISVVQNTIPSAIEVGAFDDAKIKAIITYEDSTTYELTVTSSMLSQEDQAKIATPGNYCVTIIFRDVTTEIFITIVEPVETYTVTFYDPYGDVISSQDVVSGEDAVAPTNFDWNCEFVAWDRTFTNVTKNINVYAIGSFCKTCPLPMNVAFYGSDSKYDRYDIVSFKNGKAKYFTTQDKEITEESLNNTSVKYVDYDITIRDGNWYISFTAESNLNYNYAIEFSTSLQTVEEVTFYQDDEQQSQKILVVHPSFN